MKTWNNVAGSVPEFVNLDKNKLLYLSKQNHIICFSIVHNAERGARKDGWKNYSPNDLVRCQFRQKLITDFIAHNWSLTNNPIDIENHNSENKIIENILWKIFNLLESNKTDKTRNIIIIIW